MSENLAMQDIFSKQDGSIGNFSETAGQMLKQARLDAGLHIAALAVALRVPIKRIEALENGQMDLLPDVVFVRALTSSICQSLKIDARPILDKLPKAALPRLNRDDVAINAPIGLNNAGDDSWFFSAITSPLLSGVLFLCVAAAGVYFWPKSVAIGVLPVPNSQKSSIEMGVSQAKEIQVVDEPAAVPSLSAGANTNAKLAMNGNEVSIPMPILISTALPTAASVNASNASLVGGDLVTFKASGETWVEVKSATGISLFKKLLNAGEAAGTSGTLPLTVIVGRADMTQVEVRGKPVNLVAIAKSNVARFEVN